MLFCMEEELIDYSSSSMDATQIWVEEPYQQADGWTSEPSQELDVQVDAYLTGMVNVDGNIIDLGFTHPSTNVNVKNLHYQEDRLAQFCKSRHHMSYNSGNLSSKD